MNFRKKTLKSVLNTIVVLFVASVGFIKVNTSLGYFLGVPLLTLLAYVLSNAMFTDLLFGETLGCSEKSIYKDE